MAALGSDLVARIRMLEQMDAAAGITFGDAAVKDDWRKELQGASEFSLVRRSQGQLSGRVLGGSRQQCPVHQAHTAAPLCATAAAAQAHRGRGAGRQEAGGDRVAGPEESAAAQGGCPAQLGRMTPKRLASHLRSRGHLVKRVHEFRQVTPRDFRLLLPLRVRRALKRDAIHGPERRQPRWAAIGWSPSP